MEEYLLISKERFGYSSEQALGMLLWHGYNFEKALADLANFEPQKEEWTCEEKVLFEHAFKYGAPKSSRQSSARETFRISASS